MLLGLDLFQNVLGSTSGLVADPYKIVAALALSFSEEGLANNFFFNQDLVMQCSIEFVGMLADENGNPFIGTVSPSGIEYPQCNYSEYIAVRQTIESYLNTLQSSTDVNTWTNLNFDVS
jgi:hypothetical protein